MPKIAVIGSGTMGRGIAYVAAISGFTVTLNDINQESLKNAKKYIYDEWEKSEQRGFLTKEDINKGKDNLTFSLELEECVKDADLVIEAVLEVMEVKIKVFQKLDQLCSPSTIFASNTSTMSPTEIGAHISHTEKVIAMHF